MAHKKAVVLLSGGLDSTTCLYIAIKRGYNCNCLIFDYRQKHKKEIKTAIKIAQINSCPFNVIKIKLPWAQSSLTLGGGNKKIPIHIPRATNHEPRTTRYHLPSTYVPGRNTIFISYALSYAETSKAEKIFIGANAVDFSGYPDCRPAYFNSWNSVLKSLGTPIKIETPLINLKKSRIIKLGASLGVPYKITWSCYMGRRIPCQKCDSCFLRAKGFSEAKIVDPLL